ncbi:uncharacterized protein FOMMEDRAFT_155937 [Fomitiporia mediterranea MF3/22]|uniref:uncharacterized protein n=1 Tax=Fomitiporia mediterranea (strain MF3/22) TaxID=694068 RepID=UPI0004407B6A|nr:uncharacterized protein FOMMEDRAFT_155937 [Fomitiporia mediterranea MF3/22]EJD02617.1 hypothetical protein FOMMEDRAFT_155937 [Fomitiporia mediterranea MF3/22]
MSAPPTNRVPNPASTSSTRFSHLPHQFSSQTGTTFVHDAIGYYPSFGAIPSSVPKSTTSSFASALVLAPEQDSPSARNHHTRPSPRDHDVRVMRNSPAGSNTTPTSEGSMSATLPGRQGVGTDSYVLSCAQDQTYQGGEVHRHAPISSQFSDELSYSQMHPSSSSMSFLQSNHQRPDELLWAHDEPFSMFQNAHLPPSNTAGVTDPSHFPTYGADYSFNPIGINGTGINVCHAEEEMVGWSLERTGETFPAPAGIDFDFMPDASAWSHLPSASISAPDRRSGVGFASGSSCGCNSISAQSFARSDSDPLSGKYCGEGQEASQQHERLEQYDATNGPSGVQASIPHHPSPVVGQLDGEQISSSFIHLQTMQSASPSMSVPSQYVRANGNLLQSAQAQEETVQGQVHRGHSALMPPPPIPARAHTLDSEQPKSRNRGPHSSLERRHTVAVPPTTNVLPVDAGASSAETPSVVSTRSSSAAPDSSRFRGESSSEGSATPRNATGSLNDAMWTQAQEYNRHSLSETFRQQHDMSDPPAEIREGNALHRSTRFDSALRGSPLMEKIRQVSQGQNGETGTTRGTGTGTDAHNSVIGTEPPTAPDDLSDKEFFNGPIGKDWTPAVANHEVCLAPDSSEKPPFANPLVSPISPTSTEEVTTPSVEFARNGNHQVCTTYASVAPANPASRPVLPPDSLNHYVIPVLRHDGHLAPHVSGLGGGFISAYDGRSYLTDDSEPDPEHVPPAPPGARSGDNPVLMRFLPHPMQKRGEIYHQMLNPAPQPQSGKGPPNQDDATERTRAEDGVNQTPETNDDARKDFEEKGIKSEEQGEGWGSTEGGSHGQRFALPGLVHRDGDRTGASNRSGPRLKLSTEKKTPPKMACHFCRNRKIACGPSKCGDLSICNQCERRNLRCIFPTVSRRGMRSKMPRSAHTVDGTSEVDKDSVEEDEYPDESEDNSASPGRRESRTPGFGSSEKQRNMKKSREKAVKSRISKGRGKGKGKISEVQREDQSGKDHGEVDMDGDRQEPQEADIEMRVDHGSGYADDPLASLGAAQMQWQHQQSHAVPVPSSIRPNAPASVTYPTVHSSLSSSSLSTLGFTQSTFEVSYPVPGNGDNYSLHVGSSHPFTTSPLPRRNPQSSIAAEGSADHL